MIEKTLIESLVRTEGVERVDDVTFRFTKDHEGTFYFGRHGSLAVTKVREVSLHGDLLELVCLDDHAFFTCEELMGFKVRMPDTTDRVGARAGFSSR